MLKLRIGLFILAVFMASISPVSSEERAVLSTSLPIPQAGEIPRYVNVALLEDVPSVLLSVDGEYEIRLDTRPDPILSGTGSVRLDVRSKKEGIEFNGRVYPSSSLALMVRKGSILIEKRRYRDQVQILRNAKKKLTVVNRIDLEEYLKGVLPLEVHHEWPSEALKAHAVVSRTFALFKSIEKRNQDFSLRNTIHSQVYGGVSFHKEATDQAIDLTRGEILISQGNIFPAYFHACCGGRTAEADRIWPVHPSSVLKGVPCRFCERTKYWKWSFEITLKEIEAVMRKKGYPAKNLKNIRFHNRDRSGRAAQVTLEYKRSKVTISGDDLRLFLGYNRLRSLKAQVEVKNGRAYFRGFGWGHGIGFCQWGAKGQAKAGKTYREILKYYFPGSELKKI